MMGNIAAVKFAPSWHSRRRDRTICTVVFVLMTVSYTWVMNSIHVSSRLSIYPHSTTAINETLTVPPSSSSSSSLSSSSPASTTSSSSSSSLGCLIEWDQQKTTKHIDVWLDRRVPVLITAIRSSEHYPRPTASIDRYHPTVTRTAGTSTEKGRNSNSSSRGGGNDDDDDDDDKDNAKDKVNDVVYIIFSQDHIRQGGNPVDFNNIDWMCSYNRQQNVHRRTTNMQLATAAAAAAATTTSTQSTMKLKARLAPLDLRHRNHVILICDASPRSIMSPNTTTSTHGHRSIGFDADSDNNEHRSDDSIEDHHWRLHSVYPTTILLDGDTNTTENGPTVIKINTDPSTARATEAAGEVAVPVSMSLLPNVTTAGSQSTAIVYDLTVPLQCDKLQETEHNQQHQHQQRRQIAACVRFKGVNDRRQLPEWIEYHRLIGVQHFWIFINDPWERHNGTELTELYSNRSYVSFVPFNMNWVDYPNRTNKYRYRNRDPDWSQEPSQWQCLYTAKKFGYDWVVTTDVDEYIYVSPLFSLESSASFNETSIEPTETTSTDTVSYVDGGEDVMRPPLQVFLDRYDTNRYASLIMASIPYGNNTFLSIENRTDDDNKHRYMIDYVWRRGRDLGKYKLKRYKQFYNARRTWSIGVHFLWKADDGLQKNVVLDHYDREHSVFIHHYKKSYAGVSLSGWDRMVKNPSIILSDPTLRNEYREGLDRVMKDLLVGQQS